MPTKKPLSGAAKRKLREERERAALAERAGEIGVPIVRGYSPKPVKPAKPPRATPRPAAPRPEAPTTSTPEEPDELADELAAYRSLGPPPRDPAAAIVWGNHLASMVAWYYAVGIASSEAASRRKGVLEAIRTQGMTNSKAIDKDRLKKLEKRLGLVEEDSNGALEERGVDEPPALRA